MRGARWLVSSRLDRKILLSCFSHVFFSFFFFAKHLIFLTFSYSPLDDSRAFSHQFSFYPLSFRVSQCTRTGEHRITLIRLFWAHPSNRCDSSRSTLVGCESVLRSHHREICRNTNSNHLISSLLSQSSRMLSTPSIVRRRVTSPQRRSVRFSDWWDSSSTNRLSRSWSRRSMRTSRANLNSRSSSSLPLSSSLRRMRKRVSISLERWVFPVQIWC